MFALFVYVPESHQDVVRDALAVAGAGAIGSYDSCSFSGTGRFRPLEGSRPAIGEKGYLTEVPEVRIETVVTDSRVSDVLTAVRKAHPYEEPGIFMFPLHYHKQLLNYADSAKPAESTCSTRPVSVCLEGLDGTGKSTVATMLAKRLGAVHMVTPTPRMRAFRTYFDAIAPHDRAGGLAGQDGGRAGADSTATPDEAAEREVAWLTGIRHGYYLTGNFLAGLDMSEALSSGASVVLDRYHASTWAYVLGKAGEPPPPGDKAYDWPKELQKPDYMFLLTLPETARLARRAKRTEVAETSEEAMLARHAEVSHRINEAYRRFGCTEVAAEGSAEEVVERIVTIIERDRGSAGGSAVP